MMPGVSSSLLDNPDGYSGRIVISWKWCYLLYMFFHVLWLLFPSYRVIHVAILESFVGYKPLVSNRAPSN
jgi:hypothetical protein